MLKMLEFQITGRGKEATHGVSLDCAGLIIVLGVNSKEKKASDIY
jgi:hypothetical protein